MIIINKFEKRTMDWWIYTLLPIVLSFCLSFIIYSISKNFVQILLMLVQQFLSYSIILSSTDMGITKGQDRHSRGCPWLIVIFSLTVLVCVYINETVIISDIWAPWLYLLVSIVMVYFSILSYNTNPESSNLGPSSFSEQKNNVEEKAQREFESSDKPITHFNVKTGE